MKNVILVIKENKQVSKDIYLMTLEGDCSEIKNAGEFVEILLPSHYLRRPISVSEYGNNYVKLLYKVLGKGTLEMTSFKEGASLDVLIGLGNGFSFKKDVIPTLIGGGIGIAPLFQLLKNYNSRGIIPNLVYGSRGKDDLVLIEELKKMSKLYLCTDDGTLGLKGNVIDCIKENNIPLDYYYACGPLPMLKGLASFSKNGEISLEARMGCGFGACMGCSIQTMEGPKRVCKEGPVFSASEVIF